MTPDKLRPLRREIIRPGCSDAEELAPPGALGGLAGESYERVAAALAEGYQRAGEYEVMTAQYAVLRMLFVAEADLPVRNPRWRWWTFWRPRFLSAPPVEAGYPDQGRRASDGRPDCPFNGQCALDDLDRKYPPSPLLRQGFGGSDD